MQIHSESRIHHPLDHVYRAYRDRLSEIARYIPDIKEIRVLEAEDLAGGRKVHNLWIADRDIPRVLRAVLKPEMMQWHDHASWNDEGTYVDWTLVVPAFENQVQCSGRNTFVADGDGASRVVLTGDLQIDLKKVPGVPGFMAKKLAPRVEEFIVKLITPNLVRVNESLEQFLDDLG